MFVTVVQNVSHLLFPGVEVDLAAVDSAVEQHLPSLEVNQRLKGAGQCWLAS